MTSTSTTRNVLITGASTGLGRITAMHLARRGWRVIAGVRSDADAQSLADEARSLNAPGFAVVRIDVTDQSSVARAADEVGRMVATDGLAALVNNAGICVVGPMELVALSEWRRQFEVNVFGQVAVTQAMLPLLREHVRARGCGSARIVMMSSIAGKVSQPMLGAYAASKFALEAMADALRMEIAPQGIQVSLVEPGAFESQIWRKGKSSADSMDQASPAYPCYAQMLHNLEQGMNKLAKRDPSAVAKAVERCLSRRSAPTRVVVGGDATAGAISKWLLPTRFFDMAISKTFGIPRRIELPAPRT